MKDTKDENAPRIRTFTLHDVITMFHGDDTICLESHSKYRSVDYFFSRDEATPIDPTLYKGRVSDIPIRFADDEVVKVKLQNDIITIVLYRWAG